MKLQGAAGLHFVALASLVALGGWMPSASAAEAEATEPSARRVSFAVAVLHVKLLDASQAGLPASFDPALTAKLVSGLLTPAYPAYAKPVAIPGTMRLEAPPGEAPSEITVLDAALLAARASEAIRLVRVASRSADDGSTVYFDMSLPDALPAARKASTWTCEPPMRDAYGVTPRALPGGALELEFQPPRDLGTLWSPPSTRIRVEPGETVLFALAGPLLRVPKPDSTQILRPTYPTTAEEPVETRVLLVLSPRLEP